MVKKGEGAKSEILTLKRGDCFGEQALVPQESLKRTKRKASVIAKGPQNVVCLALTPEAFHNVQHGSLLGWTRHLRFEPCTWLPKTFVLEPLYRELYKLITQALPEARWTTI